MQNPSDVPNSLAYSANTQSSLHTEGSQPLPSVVRLAVPRIQNSRFDWYFTQSAEAVLQFGDPIVKRINKVQKNMNILKTMATTSQSIRAIASEFDVSVGHVQSLKTLLKNNENNWEKALEKTSPYSGNRPFLTFEGEQLILNTLVNRLDLEVPVSMQDIRDVMCAVAQRQGHKITSSFPCTRTVERFLDNYGLDLKDGKLMKTNFTNGERIENLIAYAGVWKKLFQEYPICRNPMRIYNLDETLIDTSIGKKSQYVARKGQKEGVKRSRFTEERFSLVLISSADGALLPPIAMVPRVHIDPAWHQLVPLGTTIVAQPTTLTTARILITHLKHVVEHVRARLQDTEPFVLVVDGHGSRTGYDREWLKYAADNNVIVVVEPSCSSHYLQPNDQRINRVYKQSIRAAVDALRGTPDFENKSLIAQKLHVVNYVHGSIKPAEILESWAETLILPLDFDTFSARWMQKKKKFLLQYMELVESGVISSGTNEFEQRVFTEVAIKLSQDEAYDDENTVEVTETPGILRSTGKTDEQLFAMLIAEIDRAKAEGGGSINPESDGFMRLLHLTTTIGNDLSTGQARSMGKLQRRAARLKAAKDVGQNSRSGPRILEYTESEQPPISRRRRLESDTAEKNRRPQVWPPHRDTALPESGLVPDDKGNMRAGPGRMNCAGENMEMASQRPPLRAHANLPEPRPKLKTKRALDFSSEPSTATEIPSQSRDDVQAATESESISLL